VEWHRHSVSSGEDDSNEALGTVALQSSWWGGGVRRGPVAETTWCWELQSSWWGWRHATSVCCLLNALVLAVVGGWSRRSWVAWLPPGEMIYCEFVLHRWAGGSLHLYRVKALLGSDRGR
jgi:hypothetical protein